MAQKETCGSRYIRPPPAVIAKALLDAEPGPVAPGRELFAAEDLDERKHPSA